LGERAQTPSSACFEYRQATLAAGLPAEAEDAYRGLAACSEALHEREAAARATDLARGVLPRPLLDGLLCRDDPEALWAVGRHLLLAGDPRGAAAAFAREVEHDPLDPEAIFARARASFEAGLERPERLLGWIRTALSLGLRFSVNAAQAHLLAARCAADLGRREEAAAHLAAALRYDPSDEAARQTLAALR
jgi:tetratricopeptide (TPR) repeat protein